MDNDDETVGRVLTRREALAVLGVSGLALISGCTTYRNATDTTTSGSGMCIVRPQQTQGPYFVDEKLNRTDIRSDPSDGTTRPGAQLDLTFNVSRITSACAPLAGALVDVWHCDHLGVYSDASDPGFNTVGKKFLRGYQTTDANGVAKFTTIYPGWYQGRAVHIHFMIRSPSGTSPSYQFTSQLYFDDALTDQVHALSPYSAKGQRTRRNSGDGIFNNGGSQLLLTAAASSTGYAATFNIGLQA